VLAYHAAMNHQPLPETLHFEEIAGLVPVRLLRDNDTVTGAELLVPEALSCRSEVSPESVAACLSLNAEDIRTEVHMPVVASVGLPFLIAELAFARRFVGACRIYRVFAQRYRWMARFPSMPIPWIRIPMNLTMCRPACLLPHDRRSCNSSATAAATALLALHRNKTTLNLNVSQGVDMGRASVLFAGYDASSGKAVVRVGENV
jgi:trans-2,3-dihydro-3-hydroxyanthranilate isomerase